MRAIFAKTDRQAGSSLIDALMGIGIISIAIFYGARLFGTHMDTQARLANAGQYNEYEHVLRHGTAKFAQSLQARLTAELGCKTARTIFKQEANNVAAGLLKFGAAPTGDLAHSVLGKSWQTKLQKPYRQAISRCAKQSFSVSPSLDKKNTFYFCSTLDVAPRSDGLKAESKQDRTMAWAEFRVNLWDFNRNKPINCEELAGNPGRGSIVQYSMYLVGTSKDADKKPETRRHSGRIYVPRE